MVTDPRGVFQDMPIRGGIQAPLLFLVGCLVLAGLGFLIVGPRGFGLSPGLLGHAPLVPLRGRVHADRAQRVRRRSADYEANYRVVAYATRARWP